MRVSRRRRGAVLAVLATSLVYAGVTRVDSASAGGSAPISPGSVELTWAPTYMSNTSTYTQDQAVALAQKFDLVVGLPLAFDGFVPAMRAANPNVTLLAYTNAALTPPSIAVTETDETLFAHDVNGNRITSKSFGNDLMEPSNPDWQAQSASICEQAATANGFDGCLLDLLTMAVYVPNYVTNLPTVPGTTTPYTASQWQGLMVNLASTISTADSNLVLVGNSIGNVAQWTQAASTQPIADSLPAAQMEDFLRGSGDPVGQFPTTANWLTDVGIEQHEQDIGHTILVSTKLWSAATAAQSAAWQSYAMATFLMSAEGHAYFAFTDQRTQTGAAGADLAYSMPKQLGDPTSAMMQVGTTYQRTFTGGVAIVNPSTASTTLTLPSPMYDLSGALVSTVTLGPNQGMVYTTQPPATSPPTPPVTATPTPTDTPTATPMPTVTVTPTPTPTPTMTPIPTITPTPTVTPTETVTAEPPPPSPTVTPTPPASNKAPTGGFTAPATNASLKTGKITIRGTAADDGSVKKVWVAIRNAATGKWLTAKSTWSTTDIQLPATLAKQNVKSTTWTKSIKIPVGKVVVTLVVNDNKGLANASPQPTRAFSLH